MYHNAMNPACQFGLLTLAALFAGLNPLVFSGPKSSTPLLTNQKTSLEKRLLQEGIPSLAKAVRSKGDARRGAKVFYQHTMACAKCHTTGLGISPLGPDLAKLGKDTKLNHIIESILEPSKVIKKEFKTVQVITSDGRTMIGLVAAAKSADRIELRDASQLGKGVSFLKKDVELVLPSKVSVMPTGLVNQLADRGQFLDLVRYLEEIAKHGPTLARKLAPDPSELRRLAMEHIDHAKQIRNLDSVNIKKGRLLYVRHCVECHGNDGNKTVNPLARRFTKDSLKFGTDPYAMWKTLTYGNGLMFSQAGLLSAKERYALVHYLREQFLKDKNPNQYFKVSEKYLASINARANKDAQNLALLPPMILVGAGMIDGTQGRRMDYGPYLSHSVAFSRPKDKNAPRFENTTERALVIKLPGNHAVCYDTERYSVTGIWRGAIANTKGTHHTSYKGSSCLTPDGKVLYTNTDAKGWAIRSLDTPLKEHNLRFEGHYLHSGQVLLRFNIGGCRVEELPSSTGGPSSVLSRTLRVTVCKKQLFCLVGHLPKGRASIAPNKVVLKGDSTSLVAHCTGDIKGLGFVADGQGGVWLQIPPAKHERIFTLWYGVGKANGDIPLPNRTGIPDLDVLTKGGPRHWSKVVYTPIVMGQPKEGYAADDITVPYANPWGSWMRTTAVDFFPDGRAAVSTLSGDVWIVHWSKSHPGQASWSRFATGLYEPLGLRIVHGHIYVRGRDRITRLHDLNHDGEADYYENFYQEGVIGANYHAFIFDLQTDRKGNFYFSKSGRKSPHKGAVIRLSPDGKTSEVVCHDFRHPNGLGFGGPHDWITVADNPDGQAVFNGVALVRSGQRYGYNSGRTTPMLAVLPPTVDSSSGGQCWTDARRWGPLSHTLIHSSYSHCKLFYILTQNIGPHPNGFAIPLPFTFKSGVMRVRVNPVDGQLYAVGQKGWGTKARYDGGFYRLRRVEGSTHLLTAVTATATGLRLRFSCDLDKTTIVKKNLAVVRDGGKRTQPIKMGAVRLVDNRTVEVSLPDIGQEVVPRRTQLDKKTGIRVVGVQSPLRVTMNIKAADGTTIAQTVYATVNSLPVAKGEQTK